MYNMHLLKIIYLSSYIHLVADQKTQLSIGKVQNMDPWSMDPLRGPGPWTGSIKIWAGPWTP